jgi:serine/threonine protein phosphatase PrpC
MLSRSLGGEASVQVDVVKQGVEAGDAFVLCSDGLWDSVSQAEIASMVGDTALPLRDAADRLVDLALARTAPDNVTVVVVRVTSDRPIPSAGARRSLFRRGRG